MTAVTVLSETTGVNVIRSVAGGTGSRLPFGRLAGPMTAAAAEIFVGAGQRKIRCLAVIERPVSPAGGVVTGRALTAHGAFVMVLVRVAIRALMRKG